MVKKLEQMKDAFQVEKQSIEKAAQDQIEAIKKDLEAVSDET